MADEGNARVEPPQPDEAEISVRIGENAAARFSPALISELRSLARRLQESQELPEQAAIECKRIHVTGTCFLMQCGGTDVT